MLNMREALGLKFKLVVLGDDAQCIPVVDMIDTGLSGLTCENVNVINILARPALDFKAHTLHYGWRFRDDPPWGVYVDSIADGSAPDIPVKKFPIYDLNMFVR